MNYFYSKFITIDSVVEELHSLDLSQEEKVHLASLVDSTLHHAILDEVLSNLNEDDKKLFLKLLSKDTEHDKLMEFLETKVEGIEEKIKKVSDELVVQMKKDVKEAKRRKAK